MKRKVLGKAIIIAILMLAWPMMTRAEDFSGTESEIADDALLRSVGTTLYEKPLIENIAIRDVKEQEGCFTVSLQSVQNSENIRNIQCAVWSEINGQDDIIWYNVQNDSDGGYFCTVDISNHGYSLGVYQIHAYITDINGNRFYAGSTMQEINIRKGQLRVSVNEDASFNVKLENVVVPGGIKEVYFPVWSSVNGQDDTIWYKADQANEYQFTKKIFMKAHKGLGEYNVHAYVVTNSGAKVFVDSTVFETDVPKIGNITINNYSEKNGTFQVVMSNIEHEELLTSISVPVWSEENGQDDIVWYRPQKQDDHYICDVEIKNHEYSLGQYNIHVYMTDILNCREFVTAVTQNVDIEPGEWKIQQLDIGKLCYLVSMQGVNIPGNSNEIVFPVWSEDGGQDDIRWYSAMKNKNGVYEAVVDIQNYKSLGLFNVHAYAVMPNGDKRYISENTFETPRPTVVSLQVGNVDKRSGQFQVKITGVQNSEYIKELILPVWSEENQKDIVWYTAKKTDNEEYIVNVNISKHNYNIGKYQIHLYLVDITGAKSFITKTACDMTATYSSLVSENKDGVEKIFDISLKNLEFPAGEEGVMFAVWGDVNGQNDLRWYSANKEDKDSYSVSISINDHKELGKYYVDTYCRTKYNGLVYIGGTMFDVSMKPSLVSVSAGEGDGTRGTFRVEITGVTAPSGVEKVTVPVWCEENQSDIKWYDALKVSEGVYIVNIDVANHQYHFGNYKVHVYVTMGNGVRVFSGETRTDLNPVNYFYSYSISTTQQEVVLLGSTASRVQFPTWSNENGQDDLIWYEARSQGNGKWTAIVDSANHNNGGMYSTHVYITDSNGCYAVGATSYSLIKIPTDKILMQNRANLYSSVTPYLILVNRTTHKVGIFQGWQGNWNYVQYWDCSDGKSSTPTVEGVFRVGSRGYYFDSGDSRCYWWTQFYGDYLFHSVLYNKYNGLLNDGRLGMGLSHGCVRLDINNAKWIYDIIPSRTTVVVYH